MPTIEKFIEVNAPIQDAYNHWTKFDEFHRFIEGVQEVDQRDNRRKDSKTEIGGQGKESEVEIMEQTPSLCVAWSSRSGPITGGLVTFQPLLDSWSKVRIYVAYDPEDVATDASNALGMVSLKVQNILDQFKEFVESRDPETRDMAKSDQRSSGGEC